MVNGVADAVVVDDDGDDEVGSGGVIGVLSRFSACSRRARRIVPLACLSLMRLAWACGRSELQSNSCQIRILSQRSAQVTATIPNPKMFASS